MYPFVWLQITSSKIWAIPTVWIALFLFGEIEPKTFTFRKVREHPEITTLVLNSPGGDVWEGLKHVDRNRQKLSTYVPKLVYPVMAHAPRHVHTFFVGVQRRADGEGVHQFYSANLKKWLRSAMSSAQFIVSEIMQTLSGSNVPQFVFIKCLSILGCITLTKMNSVVIDGPMNSDFRRKTNNFINFLNRQIAAARKPANQNIKLKGDILCRNRRLSLHQK